MFRNPPDHRLSVVEGGNALRKSIQIALLDFMTATSSEEETMALATLIAVDWRMSKRAAVRLVASMPLET